MNGISKFESELHSVTNEYPLLKIAVTPNYEKILKGRICILNNEDNYSENGLYWYSVEIHPNSNYPYRFPLLFETDGVIPRIPDWHIYPQSGNCCVTFPREEEIRCYDGITLLEYIKEYVIPFFKNTTFRRVEGYYYTGEYDHNPILATYQFYKDLLFEENPCKIIDILSYIKNNNPPNRVSLCFCGSNKKYRHCHKNVYGKIKRISNEHIIADIQTIQDIINILLANRREA